MNDSFVSIESKANLRVCFFIPSVLQTRINIYGSHSRCLRSIKRDVGFDLAIFYNYEILHIKMPVIHRLRAFLNALLIHREVIKARFYPGLSALHAFITNKVTNKLYANYQPTKCYQAINSCAAKS